MRTVYSLPIVSAYTETTTSALTGLRVLDLSRVMAGNMLSLQLADHGADVIKIEAPGQGDPLRAWLTEGIQTWWKVYARNKRSLTLNLRAVRGREILLGLVRTSHVLIENYRPGTLEKMGLAPEVLLAAQPKLVIVRISAWGQTGPFRHKPGFGTLVEAYSGLAARTGFADQPPVLPNLALADMVAGLYGFGAVLAALRAAETPEGRGQAIDLSLFEAMVSLLGADVAATAISGIVPPRDGSRSPTAAPRNVYRTADDRWVALSGTTQAMTERLLRTIGQPELIADDRFATNRNRLRNVEALDEIIGAFIGQRTQAENLRIFDAAEVTIGPVNDSLDLLGDAFVAGRSALVAFDDPDTGPLPMHNVVPRFETTPGRLRRPAPTLGQDTDDILGLLGLTDDDKSALRSAGVV